MDRNRAFGWPCRVGETLARGRSGPVVGILRPGRWGPSLRPSGPPGGAGKRRLLTTHEAAEARPAASQLLALVNRASQLMRRR